MRDSDCALGFIDVLTARARRAVGIDFQVFFVDYDIDIVVDFRHNFKGSKARMAAFIRIEGRYSDQSVDAHFGFEVAVSVFSLNCKSNGFYTGFFSVEQIHKTDLVASSFGVARIHSVKHTHPILRFGSARARVKGKDCVIAVVFSL